MGFYLVIWECPIIDLWPEVSIISGCPFYQLKPGARSLPAVVDNVLNILPELTRVWRRGSLEYRAMVKEGSDD